MDPKAPKLIEQWPTLAGQLRAALIRAGEAELATQVDDLRALKMCACGDDFCQSFYTQPPPDGSYPPDKHRNWYPEADDPGPGWDGYLILDVVDGRIAFVEILDRPPLD
ncbi:hypothetical protein GCM10009789_54700 [Kribbella sancticallisti]|uniref:Uncharacterized protein n=1 Tax=Kribbella sancticallisti TaxID=460087 RepID=A0ABN2E4W9_9ACTN